MVIITGAKGGIGSATVELLRRRGAQVVGLDLPECDVRSARARAAAQALSRGGTSVRYVSSIFVPEDETCFLLFEAESAAAVEAAVRRAQLAFERVSEAHASGAVKD